MEINLIGGTGQGRNKLQNANLCQNFFVDVDKEGNASLIGSPGLKEFADTGHPREVRGGILYGTKIYMVVGEQFFSVDSSGSATRIFGVLDSTYGRVTLAKVTGQIGIVDEANYYLWKESTNQLVKQTGLTFTPESIADQDGRFIFNALDSDTFYISGLNDGETIGALDYASAEASPDYTRTIVSDHRELWHFGDESIEPFYNSGNADFPFERVSGAFIDRGLGAVESVAPVDNSLMWLDNLFQVVRANGYVPQTISTPDIAYQIAKCTTKTDAIGYPYTLENHYFYTLVFPTDGKCFVYDAATQLWHTRTSGADDSRHRGNMSLLFGGNWIIGDYKNGKLYTYDLDTHTDNSEVMVSRRRARVRSKGRKLMRHSRLELEIETGVGLYTGQGSDPKVMMRFSDDNGRTWSNERWRDIGKMGKTKTRVRWNQLGASRDRLYEFTITDPVKRHITGAYLNE